MTAQQIMQDSRMVRMRALKDEVSRLKEELARACEERDGLREHLALALLAARDGEALGRGGTMLIVDGWNAILGSVKVKLHQQDGTSGREGLRAQLKAIVRRWLENRPGTRAWIVFDGSRADGRADGRIRITYTGGTGEHRADRLVCDYLRMRRFAGDKWRVIVATNDKAFRAEAERLGAETAGVEELELG